MPATANMRIDQGRIAGGVWEGILTGADRMPVIEVLHEGRAFRPSTAASGRFSASDRKLPLKPKMSMARP